MRYDSEHKQQTRSKVLDVAARAIRSSGPDRVGVAAIMAEAGLTHGGFYAHFASKDELVAAAIETMFDQARDATARGHRGSRCRRSTGAIYRWLSVGQTPRGAGPGMSGRCTVLGSAAAAGTGANRFSPAGCAI